ncbi:hypothetical protein HK107_10675 [Parvularcula sp. ZS-1/3]|uniref:Uncharacterized protein n=1 Tax=Parvularcula mediterranea TaxID=2732508 RepID=A0A7Y3RP28_9PROT|nr:hypothetical protein [Parvularcula mediterranea]NNU16782.1 hypothetical protein [Parvularcula mediterranea]
MKKIALPLAVLSAVALSGCIITDTDGYSDKTSLQERTRLAVEACGAGNVAKVSSTGFTCKEPLAE